MGSHVSKQLERRKAISTEKKAHADLQNSCGCEFPGCDYMPFDRKNWMSGVGPDKLHINKIVWPGTHDSATNKIGIIFVSRPFAQCQSLSIYKQLVAGTRVLDIRVQEDRRVCHGILKTYSVDVVLADLKRFLSETESEIVILEIRTEFGHEDPPEFDKYLIENLGEHLIHQDDNVFNKTVAELLPKRRRLSKRQLDLPWTKFESNIKHLSQQNPATSRKFFYRVESTVTPQPDNPIMCVKPVTKRIHCYAKLFIIECVKRGCADKLQIFSKDFIDKDFVDACVGLTFARAEDKGWKSLLVLHYHLCFLLSRDILQVARHAYTGVIPLQSLSNVMSKTGNNVMRIAMQIAFVT